MGGVEGASPAQPDGGRHDDAAHRTHAGTDERPARHDPRPQHDPGLGLGRAAGELSQLHVPAWLRKTSGEARWPITLAVVVLVGLQLAVRRNLEFHPPYLLPGLELVLFLILLIGNPGRISRESTVLRVVSIGLVSAASLAVAWSVSRLAWEIIHGRGTGEPLTLFVNGGAIWLTNVIVFTLWYWEFDRGGPAARANARRRYPDFLFSQMLSPHLAPPDWEPAFTDYLYLSFTNAVGFSPADTLPLTRWAKLTMLFQAVISLVTIVLVVARAVNVID